MARSPKLDEFPAELKAARRWITWRYEARRGKATKKPVQSTTKPGAWLPVGEACDFVDRGAADGVGIVLGDGLVGVDIDGCISEDGTLHEMGRDALSIGCYVETSPGGRGLHVFVYATILKPRKVTARHNIPGAEIYDGRKGSARFFTVTGDRVSRASGIGEGPQAQAALDTFVVKWLPEEPKRVELTDNALVAGQSLDDDQVLHIMFGANDGAKWRAIYNGDHSRYPSQSEADLALCRKLRFYSSASSTQVARLFRGSGLMRAKWDERHGNQTYGERTIARALAMGGRVYTPRDKTEGAKIRVAWERTAFAQIPAWVFIRLGGAGELALRVYGLIACYADQERKAWPAAGTLAFHLRVSERRVKEALRVIKAAGVATWTRRARKSNLYRLAITVPETITPYALKGRASKVLETVTSDAPRQTATGVTDSGHLGCSSHGTVTNQEPTMIDTGDDVGRAIQIEGSKLSDELVALWEPTVRLTQSARLLRDEMLRGPVGKLFLERSSIQSTGDGPGLTSRTVVSRHTYDNRCPPSAPSLFVLPSERVD